MPGEIMASFVVHMSLFEIDRVSLPEVRLSQNASAHPFMVVLWVSLPEVGFGQFNLAKLGA